MSYKIHPNAKLTPKLREQIRNEKGRIKDLAKKYNVHENTIRKWKKRENFEDRPHTRYKLCFKLNEFEEALICEVKKLTLFSLDDLLFILQPYIPQLTRKILYSCLKRHHLNRNDLILPKQEQSKKEYKSFKDYPPGYIHIDVKYLPKINGQRKYLFVAIDRKTRMAFIKVYDQQTDEAAKDFLYSCQQYFPFTITKVLTDNGKCFTDRFVKGRKEPSGNHLFDQTCQELQVEHRLTQPYSPKTNGMVERMNGRLSENILDKFHFSSYQELENKLCEYIYCYNVHIKQKNLGYLSPVEYYRKYCEQEKNLEVIEKLNKFAAELELKVNTKIKHNHRELYR